MMEQSLKNQLRFEIDNARADISSLKAQVGLLQQSVNVLTGLIATGTGDVDSISFKGRDIEITPEEIKLKGEVK